MTLPIRLGAHAGVMPGRPLTARERAVLVLLARGLGIKEIGATLGSTASTVKNHQTNLYVKLDARNASHAVGIAFAAGLLTAADLLAGDPLG